MIKAFLIFTFSFSSFFGFHLQAGKVTSFPRTRRSVNKVKDLPRKIIQKAKRKIIQKR